MITILFQGNRMNPKQQDESGCLKEDDQSLISHQGDVANHFLSLFIGGKKANLCFLNK